MLYANVLDVLQPLGNVSANPSFFSIWVFFHDHSRITGLQGKGEGISLTPHYHFHPLHRHLDISRAITAESSPLHIASSRTRPGNLLVSQRKSLTTKLRALKSFLGRFYRWSLNKSHTIAYPISVCRSFISHSFRFSDQIFSKWGFLTL